MNTNLEQFKKEAVERAERLYMFAIDANEHFRTAQEIRTLFFKNREVFNMAEFFFQQVYSTYQTYILLALGKTFCDKESTNHNENESSIRLLNDIIRRKEEEFNHSFDVEEYESTLSTVTFSSHFRSLDDVDKIIQQRIKKKTQVIDRIRTLRRKYYAHMDFAKSKDYSKLFEDNLISMKDLDELLNLNFTICNIIKCLLGQGSHSNLAIARGSLDSLAMYAEKGKKTRKGGSRNESHRN